MPQQLIGITEVCKALKISRDTFYRREAGLLADGLKEVNMKGGKARRFLQSSLDELLLKAAQTGNPIGAQGVES